MPSETDLLNGALGMVGASRVTAIDDGSTNANHCQTFYPPLRDGLMRAHHWNFSVKRASLAQDEAAPAFEVAYQYTLPSDPWCLKVIEYNGANLDTSRLSLFEAAAIIGRYKIEGRKLLTNDGTVLIVYLARITNPDEWDALFYQMVQTWLASYLASAIPKDLKKSALLLQQAQEMWTLATAVDGQEGSVEPFRCDTLLRGR